MFTNLTSPNNGQICVCGDLPCSWIHLLCRKLHLVFPNYSKQVMFRHMLVCEYINTYDIRAYLWYFMYICPPTPMLAPLRRPRPPGAYMYIKDTYTHSKIYTQNQYFIYILVPPWLLRPGPGYFKAARSGLGIVLALATGVAWAFFHVDPGPNRSLDMTPFPTWVQIGAGWHDSHKRPCSPEVMP